MSNKQREEQFIRDQEYLPIPQSDLVVKIGQLLLRLKEAKIDNIKRNTIEAELKGDKIYYESSNKSLPVNMWFMDLKQAKKCIRVSVIQLLQFILYEYNSQRNNIINLNISDFLKLRGIKRRKENVDRLFEDFAILFGIKIEIETKVKNDKQIAIGNLAMFKGYKYSKSKEIDKHFETNRKIDGIVIELGDWIKKINLKQYALIHSNFFKYNSKSEANNIMISLKFTQLIRTNIKILQRNKYHNCRIKTLLDFINISDIKVKKQGVSYYYSLLLKTMNSIEVSEKYEFHFKHDIAKLNYNDFLKLNIGYTNNYLMDYYKFIKRGKNK